MLILFWKTEIDIPWNIIITCTIWSEKSPLNYISVLQTQIVAEVLLYGWEKKENVKHVNFNTFSLLFSLFTLKPGVKKIITLCFLSSSERKVHPFSLKSSSC